MRSRFPSDKVITGSTLISIPAMPVGALVGVSIPHGLPKTPRDIIAQIGYGGTFVGNLSIEGTDIYAQNTFQANIRNSTGSIIGAGSGTIKIHWIAVL